MMAMENVTYKLYLDLQLITPPHDHVSEFQVLGNQVTFTTGGIIPQSCDLPSFLSISSKKIHWGNWIHLTTMFHNRHKICYKIGFD